MSDVSTAKYYTVIKYNDLDWLEHPSILGGQGSPGDLPWSSKMHIEPGLQQ